MMGAFSDAMKPVGTAGVYPSCWNRNGQVVPPHHASGLAGKERMVWAQGGSSRWVTPSSELARHKRLNVNLVSQCDSQNGYHPSRRGRCHVQEQGRQFQIAFVIGADIGRESDQS